MCNCILLLQCIIFIFSGWECEYNELLKYGNMRQYYEKHCKPFPSRSSTLTGHDLIDRIRKDDFFGLVEVGCYNNEIDNAYFHLFQVDLRLPEFLQDLRARHANFPPIFKNIDMDRNDLWDKMRDYAEEKEILASPRRTLVSSFYGTRVLLSTSLFQ